MEGGRRGAEGGGLGAGEYLDLVGGDELVHLVRVRGRGRGRGRGRVRVRVRVRVGVARVHARDAQPVEHVGRELVETHLRAGRKGG